MTQQEYIRLLRDYRKEVDSLTRRKLPSIVGTMARDHYHDNFRQSGYVHKGIKKWEPAKRLTMGRKGASAKYPTLLSSSTNLFRGLQYTPGDGRVTISNPVPYAPVHNWGFKGVQNVKPYTRKNSLRKYSLKGRIEDRIAVKGHTRNVIMPQRQFLGESAELNAKINDRIERELQDIMLK